MPSSLHPSSNCAPLCFHPCHPADYTWQFLLLIVRGDKVFLLCSQSLIPHPRMAQITVGADMRPGRRSVTTPFSTWNSFFSSWIGECVASLSGKCDLSTSCCLAMSNVTIGAATVTINTDTLPAQLLDFESAVMIMKMLLVDVHLCLFVCVESRA